MGALGKPFEMPDKARQDGGADEPDKIAAFKQPRRNRVVVPRQVKIAVGRQVK